MKRIKKIFILCIVFSASLVFSQTDKNLIYYASLKEKAKQWPRFSFRLIEVMDRVEREDTFRVVQTFKAKGMLFQQDRVQIILEAEHLSDIPYLEQSVKKLNGVVHSKYRVYLKAEIPLSRLKELNDLKNIKCIDEPMRPFPVTVNGEEIQLAKAPLAWTNGSRGKNIKVAVIDGGFQYLSLSILNNELPNNVITYDFSGTGLTNDTEHGTAVAEVIHELAPEAQLYLLKIYDLVDVGNAKDYCISQGVQIINHSYAWVNTEWGDGSGPVCDIANDATNHNILWVNAAGNAAKRHWQAFFNDLNVNSYQDFTGTTEDGEINEIGSLSLGDEIEIFLCWNDAWGSSANDYDLELYWWSGLSWNFVEGSYNSQEGYQNPTESISTLALNNGRYGVKIKKYSGAARDLQLFSFTQDFENQTLSKSLTAPADATGVLAVGAMDQSQWVTGPVEDFSSRGPTKDGRTKPDICGVDGNTNFIYTRFYGTSSASPCVAGCAALVWSSYTGFNYIKTRDLLEKNAIDMGAPGKDNDYGEGRVQIRLDVRGTPAIPLDSGQATLFSNITFTWQKGSVSNHIVSYFVQISTNQSTPLFSQNTGTNRALTYAPARHARTYYARVCGTNIFDQGGFSGWSDGIIRDTNAPGIPPGIPQDRGAWSGTNILFSWTKAMDPESGISNYSIVISTNTNSGVAVFSNNSISGTNYSYTGLAGRSYWARVAGNNHVGLRSVYSGWSDGIKVDDTLPSRPGTPVDTGTLSNKDLFFFWTKAMDSQTGISWYRVQIVTDTNSGTSAELIAISTNCSFTGTHNKTYYARVRAVNWSGLEGTNSGWSDGILVDTMPSITTISPEPDKPYAGEITISLQTSEANAKIYCSTNGQEPQVLAADLYTQPFLIHENRTIKFFSIDQVGNQEETRSVTFEIIKTPLQPVEVYNNLLNRSDSSMNKVLIVFAKSGGYRVQVLNIKGEQVQEWPLVNYKPGDVLEWDGKAGEKRLGSSIYFIHVRSDSFEKIFKVLIVE